MFFLKDKYVIGYVWGSPTFYGTKHLGIDYIVPSGTKIFAPFNGIVVKTFYGTEGGYTTWFRPDGQNVTYRFLHLSKQLVLSGSHVNEGDLIALSGNTGAETTGPHVHFDCFTGNILPVLVYTNFINPSTINFNPIEMFSQKIILLTYKVPDIVFMKSWVDYALNWMKQVTDNQFEIQVTYVDKSLVVWRTISGVNGDGAPVIYVDPIQVLDEGVSPQNREIVTLIADYDKIVPRPTFDEAFPIMKYGMTISEKSALNPGGDLTVNASFLIHEWLHNWYFILNSQGINLVDDVHKHSNITDPNPQANFSDIVLKLKPYWPLLTRKGEPMLIINNTSNPSAKFVLENEFKRGYADFPAFQKDTAGRTIINITLADVEFNKIPTSQAVIKS